MQSLIMWAHGTALKNKHGGWGFISLLPGSPPHVMEKFGCKVDTNPKTMELQAVVNALQDIQGNPSTIVFYTTSKYVIAGVKDSKKHLKADMALWSQLQGLQAEHEITWKSTGILPADQARVEQLCKQGIASIIDNDAEDEEDAA